MRRAKMFGLEPRAAPPCKNKLERNATEPTTRLNARYRELAAYSLVHSGLISSIACRSTSGRSLIITISKSGPGSYT